MDQVSGDSKSCASALASTLSEPILAQVVASDLDAML
jgi:hypothetical protein